MNMSYCRMRNTLNDLRDCKEAMYDKIEDEEEKLARTRLIELCREIADEFQDEDFEEEYDDEEEDMI